MATAGSAAGGAPRAECQSGAAAEPRPREPSAPAQAPGQLRLPAVPAPVQLLSVFQLSRKPLADSRPLSAPPPQPVCCSSGARSPTGSGHHSLPLLSVRACGDSHPPPLSLNFPISDPQSASEPHPHPSPSLFLAPISQHLILHLSLP